MLLTHASLLAADLAENGPTLERLDALAGTAAVAALDRGEAQPLRRALAAHPDEPAAVLARLFVLGDPVATASVGSALVTLGLDHAAELGVLRVDGDLVVPLIAIRPYAIDGEPGWIASDLDELAGVFPLRPDHVLGVGGAGRTLVSLLPPIGAGRALDLGCGCGIIALHLRRRGYDVIATDISERALWFTRLNAALNGIDGVETRRGSLFEPVAGERFDLIASNPPFVITPRVEGVPAYEYRDGGAEGDALMAAVVGGIGVHLTPTGSARLLGNWEDAWGARGIYRVRDWAGDTGVWVIEREQLDPVRYGALWVRDGGSRPGTPEYERLLDAWLDDFDRRGVRGIGLGWVVMTAHPLERIEAVGHSVDPSEIGGHVARALEVSAVLAGMSDGELAASVLRVAQDVTEARHHMPGAEDPSIIELRQGGGFARTIDADPALVALVGACDGDLDVGTLVTAIAQLMEVDAAALRADLVPRVRELLFTGVLEFV